AGRVGRARAELQAALDVLEARGTSETADAMRARVRALLDGIEGEVGAGNRSDEAGVESDDG
ncbi:MAG TPA: hypothetical protein RMH99_01545, partial [Sandaracinaceae bacterium LLY-WYZ-13_1]|nr:hypothetical protein [Sandaracinaceae bacterium LLY-WYZ-13_1]